jgi:RNA polymerase sigma-70 factor, ECF subfamily
MDDLIQRAQTGEQWALSQLYDMSRTRVYRLALTVLGDPSAAEEVMQDSLHYALTNVSRFDAARAAWTTWLYTITLSRCRNRARRRWTLLPLISSFLAGGPSPTEHAEYQETVGALNAALLRLSPKLREAVALRFLGELDYTALGTALGCSPKTAQSRVRLGLERLRVLVQYDPDLAVLRDAWEAQ